MNKDPQNAVISDAEKAQTLISDFSSQFLRIAHDTPEKNRRSTLATINMSKDNWRSVALANRLSNQVSSAVFDRSIDYTIQSDGDMGN